MSSTTPPGDEQAPDYEQLRKHLARPRLEHPAPRAREPAGVAPESDARITVVTWIAAIGRAVVRRMRRATPSAMVQLHPRK